MRTTVTLDSDTESLLREETQRSGRSFKVVLNESVRKALAKKSATPVSIEPLFDSPFPSEYAKVNFNHLADAWDDDKTLQELNS